MRRSARWAVLVLLAAALVAAALYRAEVAALLAAFARHAQALGPWGPVLLALAYIPACLLFFPGSALTLGAGSVFGLTVGFVAVSLGSTAGAAAAFIAGRTLLRNSLASYLTGNAKFAALERAVARQGFKIVLLTRLSPAFPFNLLNYAFGLTAVRFRDYLLASWLGMMPGTMMYVYLGYVAREAVAAAHEPAWHTADYLKAGLKLLGLLATVAITLVITRLARQALRDAEFSEAPHES